jgi:hypothetical protein
VKDENGDLLADSHCILNRWKRYFSQLLNVHVSDVRQTEIHTAETLVSCPSYLRFKIAIPKLRNIYHQVVTKFLQNRFKQGVKH